MVKVLIKFIRKKCHHVLKLNIHQNEINNIKLQLNHLHLEIIGETLLLLGSLGFSCRCLLIKQNLLQRYE